MDGGLRDKMLPQRPGSARGVLVQLLALLRAVWAWLQANLLPRTVRIGPHRLSLVRLIAEGAFGYVHVAIDVSTRQQFAVKEVLCQTVEARQRLEQEIDAHLLFSAAKRHENIMPLLGHTFVRDGGHSSRGYLLLPLLGRTLQDVLTATRPPGSAASSPGPLTPQFFSERACLTVAKGLARALSALHRAGHTHRDVCPRNVLLAESRDGPGPAAARVGVPDITSPHAVVLSDLGSIAAVRVAVATRADAARVLDEASTQSSPPYRAPELFYCEPGAEIGPPVDLFSLGATLYACAFGLSPFESVRHHADGQLRIVEPGLTRTVSGVQFPAAHAFSRGFCDLVLALCEQDSGRRCGLEEVLQRIDTLLGMEEASV